MMINYEAIRCKVIGMGAKDKRKYELQYLCEIEILGTFTSGLCDECGSSIDEPDIHCSDCPAGYDVTDISCSRSYVYDGVKEALIEADFLLRARLGSIWDDEYTDFIYKEVC